MIKCNLAKLLAEHNLTAEQLETETNISHGVIRHLLDGTAHDIHFDVLEALCVFFKCDVDELLSHQIK